MKSKVVSRPANVEVFESQRGADTMPVRHHGQHDQRVPHVRRRLPFWTRMERLFFTRSAVSKMIKRKLKGSTS